MHTPKRISRILTALILATMLLPPASASAAVEPASIQSEETAALALPGTTPRPLDRLGTTQTQDSAQSTEAAKARVLEAYGQLPLSFIPNQGQVDKRVGYYVQSSGQSLWFTASGVTMALPKTTLRLEFLDANPSVRLEGGDKLPGIVNYFIGNDPAKWRTNTPTYSRVTYRDLWHGVDLTYEGQPAALKSTFTIAPGADPAQIRLAYPDADSLAVDGQGNLIISVDRGEVRESAPLAWQEIEGRRMSVAVNYQVAGQSYSFALSGGYDPAYPLVIDPELVYSTFLGGSSGETGRAVAIDGAGNAYLTGYTSSSDFPITPGAFDTSYNGDVYDAFVVKLNATGSALTYATFLGGSGWDWGCAIAVDGAGSAYVTGLTGSSDFPTTPGAFDTALDWYEAFVVKLNATGSALAYATFLGGSDDDRSFGIAVDGTGNAYVTGYTYSSDFPTTTGVFDTSYNGNYDAFVAKLNATGSGLVYATFLGGNLSEKGTSAIAVDGMGNAYVTGHTYSSDFPTTAGAFDTSHNGSTDVYVVKLNAVGTGLAYATFLGGSDGDVGYAIAVGGAGSAYVTGRTSSSDFPTTVGAFDTSYNGGGDAFVAKVNAGGTGLAYATFLGGSSGEHGWAIAVDGAGSAYVTGDTWSSDFPTTAGAFDTSYNGGLYDAYVVKVNAGGTGLAYATFLGGSDGDVGYATALDGTGSAYLAGSTGSSDFPTTAGAFDTSYNGGDAFVAKLDLEGAVEPFTGTISPVYPTSHTTPSPVMQGGMVYRHCYLTDSGGSPIPNATVTLSTGESAISGASGYFTATVQTDGLGGLGSHAVSVQSVTYSGQTYTTNGEPSFSVEVTERRYAHSWECGAVRKASGGVSSGLVAYLTGEVNGGMALTLKESDPDVTDDDQVTMAENYTGEAGAGFGADFSPSIKGGLVKVEGPGAHLVGELLLRTEAGVSTTFSDPYQKAAREAQGLMLLVGIADSITGFPGQPLLADILARANVTLPYDEVTVGGGVHERADLGLDGLRLSFLIGKNDAPLNAIDLNILAATGDLTVVTGHRYYNTQISEFYILDLSWQASSLSAEIGPIKNLIGNYVGEYVATVQEEVFYDQNTGQVSQIELSITGEGNDLTFTDIDQNRVTTRYIIQSDQIDQTVLNAAHNLSGLIRGVASSETADLDVGNDPIIAEINGLLGNVGFAEYKITTEDGAQLNLVREIDLEGIKIDLGGGVKLKRARQLVYQKGVLLNGQPYPTASYQADGYVSHAGKDWLQLSANAVGGLWDLVKDAFTWVSQQVASGVGWVIGIVSETVSGVIQGGAQITAPPGAQTDSITVTAVGWVPTSTVGISSLGLSPALAAASGQDFVVGGIYEFQPYTLTISPAATLVITYTDEAAAGVDESHLGMFRWNPDGNSWQPMVAQADLANNTFTASITQLGTFALGYDDTPPQISILTPADGSTISNKLPLISALIAETGVGIDLATVEMQLSGQVVAADYITGTGQLAYLPAAPLANGTYTVTVSAADVVGNSASVSTTFRVEDTRRIYLPITLKNYTPGFQPPPPTVETLDFKVSFQARDNADNRPHNVPIKVKIKNLSGDQVLFETDWVLVTPAGSSDNWGTASVDVSSAGLIPGQSYQIFVKGAMHLAKQVTISLTDGLTIDYTDPVLNPDGVLWACDVNLDNQVSNTDVSIVLSHYGTAPTDPEPSSEAYRSDQNGDGVVNSFDLAICNTNLGKVGD